MQITKSTIQTHHTARLNRLIQAALLAGLTVSMLFMIAGAILYALHGQPAGGTGVAIRLLLPAVAAGNPMALMVLGVLVLMITPALRVVVAAVGYLLDHDYTFALVSAGVVLILITSMLIGNG